MKLNTMVIVSSGLLGHYRRQSPRQPNRLAPGTVWQVGQTRTDGQILTATIVPRAGGASLGKTLRTTQTMIRSKWEIAHLGLIASGFCIALAGCATAPPATREVPVVERSTTVETAPDRPALSQQAPASVPKAPPSSGEAPQQPSLEPATLPETPVVVALLDTADRQKQAGQLPAAAASLERALRIEPRNPETWYQLAIVRFHQGQFGQAEQLARKAEALAGSDNAARTRSWRLIAAARQQAGDREGARLASEKAAGLTGSN